MPFKMPYNFPGACRECGFNRPTDAEGICRKCHEMEAAWHEYERHDLAEPAAEPAAGDEVSQDLFDYRHYKTPS